jgi:hypothetical protein
MKSALALILVLLTATSALADSIDRSKVYVSKPEACKALKSKGVDAFQDSDFMAMTFKDGIQSDEFHCTFYDVKSKPNSDSILVEAICEEPGIQYPDLLAISPESEGTIQVTSMAAAQEQGTNGGPATDAATTAKGGSDANSDDSGGATTIYTRCDKLSGLPRD